MFSFGNASHTRTHARNMSSILGLVVKSCSSVLFHTRNAIVETRAAISSILLAASQQIAVQTCILLNLHVTILARVQFSFPT